MEGVNWSLPLPFLLTILPLADQLLWELTWLEMGLLVSAHYRFLKSLLPRLHQFLHLDHWLSLIHALPSDVAVTGKEISLFRNLSAGW